MKTTNLFSLGAVTIFIMVILLGCNNNEAEKASQYHSELKKVKMVEPFEPVDVSVSKRMYQETGIAGPYTIKTVYFGDRKVPLCNCRQGNYLVAVSSGDTARAFFSSRGEYLSSVVLVKQHKDFRVRHFESSDGEVFDRAQRRVGGQWGLDYQSYTRGDTTIRSYYNDIDIDAGDALGPILLRIRENQKPDSLGRFIDPFSREIEGERLDTAIYNGTIRAVLGDNVNRSVEKGDFFLVSSDIFVGDELVERRGDLFVIPVEEDLDPHDRYDFGTGMTWLPREMKFKR